MTCSKSRSALPYPHQRTPVSTHGGLNGHRHHPAIQVHTKNAEPVSLMTKYRRMLQLQEKEALHEGMPPAQETTTPMEKALLSPRSHL